MGNKKLQTHSVIGELRRMHSPLENEFDQNELGKLPQETEKKDLTNPRKRATIRTSINYCCVPGKQEPAFVGLADLQDPPHKWHGFRIFAHNPEVSGSNPLPATQKTLEEVSFLLIRIPSRDDIKSPCLIIKHLKGRLSCNIESKYSLEDHLLRILIICKLPY